jgi:hypothetical protein
MFNDDISVYSPPLLFLYSFFLYISLPFRPVISPLMNHPRKEEDGDGVGRKSDKARQDKAMHTKTHEVFTKILLLTTYTCTVHCTDVKQS